MHKESNTYPLGLKSEFRYKESKVATAVKDLVPMIYKLDSLKTRMSV